MLCHAKSIVFPLPRCPATAPQPGLGHHGLDSHDDPARVDLADTVFGLAPLYFTSRSDLTDLAKHAVCTMTFGGGVPKGGGGGGK
jgi:hypothetical protein